MTADAKNDYWSQKAQRDSIVSLASSGDWRGVLDAYDKDSSYRDPLLVWVRPSIGLLQFLETHLTVNNDSI